MHSPSPAARAPLSNLAAPRRAATPRPHAGASSSSRLSRSPSTRGRLALCLAALVGLAGAACDKGGAGSTTGPGPAPGEKGELAVTISGAEPRAVSPHFFGQNYWSWVRAWGDPVAGTQSSVAELGLGLLRAGGANNETGDPEPFSLDEIDDFLAFAKAVGAEPLLQISVINDPAGEPATAEAAADVVRHVNETREAGVKLFSIGNEPDLYTEQGHAPSGYSASDACATFAEYAQAMRAVDSNIQILGPELSWRYVVGNDWLTPFLQECGEHVDIVAVHRYPFEPNRCTESAAYADAASFRRTIQNLRRILEATGQGDKPLAITEANITWDGEPAKSVHPASPGTFPAGLWVADQLGIGLEEGLYTLAFWSLSEGWTLGFYDGTTPRPAAHVLRLFATGFGSEVLQVTGSTAQVSVYAGRHPDAKKTTVFVVNKTENPYDVSVELADLPRSEGVSLSVRPISLTVAEIADDGGDPKITVFDASMDAPE